jgi:hypothetical protein
MSDATNKDNLVSHLSRVYVEKRTSSKTGNDYHVQVSVWNLGDDRTYTQESFLNNEQLALITSSKAVKSDD